MDLLNLLIIKYSFVVKVKGLVEASADCFVHFFPFVCKRYGQEHLLSVDSLFRHLVEQAVLMTNLKVTLLKTHFEFLEQISNLLGFVHADDSILSKRVIKLRLRRVLFFLRFKVLKNYI